MPESQEGQLQTFLSFGLWVGLLLWPDHQGGSAAIRDAPLSLLLAPGSVPIRPVMDDPTHESFLEPDVAAGLFGLDPLVFQDFLPLGEKRAIERWLHRRIAAAIISKCWLVSRRHSGP